MSILIFVLVILCFSCLFRVLRGPTIPDRMVAIDSLGILGVGICGPLAIFTERGFLMCSGCEAQMDEQSADNRQVGGSSPLTSTNHKPLKWRIPRYLCMVRKSCSIQG